jgi:membrane protease YdiL (CAAX protease family)
MRMGRSVDVWSAQAGLFAFAALHHRPGWWFVAWAGLLLACLMMFRRAGQVGWSEAFGLRASRASLMTGLAPAVALGIALGMSARVTSMDVMAPVTLTLVGPLTALIGGTEELMFRGYVQGALQPQGRWLAVFVTAFGYAAYKMVLFLGWPEPTGVAVWHMGFYTFITGLVLALWRSLSGHVWFSVAAHMAFDLWLYGDRTVVPWWVWG